MSEVDPFSFGEPARISLSHYGRRRSVCRSWVRRLRVCVVAVVSCLCVAYPPTAVAHGVSNGSKCRVDDGNRRTVAVHCVVHYGRVNWSVM